MYLKLLVFIGFLAQLVMAAEKVKMDIYMMSKCPDAVRAMRDLAAVYYDVNGRLDLKFNYIGKADNSTSYGVTCPHGKSGKSCFGNIQQLCVQDKNPDDQDSTLQFVLCQQQLQPLKNTGTYSILAQCLRATQPLSKWSTITRCAMGAEGKQLLIDSVTQTLQKNFTISLTFALNGHQRCQYDSGNWSTNTELCPGGSTVPLFVDSINKI